MTDLQKNFEKIYDKYITPIYRFVFLKVNSQEIAEDITSEVFLKAWKAFKNKEIHFSKNSLFSVLQSKIRKSKNNKTQKKIKNPRAFLYQVARNLVIDYYRNKNKTKITSIESYQQEYHQDIEDPRINLEKEIFLSLEIKQIRNNLANIKQDYQDVIIWHYLDDLSIQEIAEIFNKSEQAVRVTLHRALKALREQFKDLKK